MQHETLVVSGEFDTVDHLLAAAAAQHGERDAYVGPDDRMSFAEWHLRSDLVAEELRRRGVGRGDVVALVMPNSCDFAVVFAAIAKLGAVTTALNTRLGPQEMEAIAQTCMPRLVVRDGTLATPPLSGEPLSLLRSELAEIYARVAVDPPRGQCDPADPVVIMWTSGTTGNPKGPYLDHRNLKAVSDAAGPMSAPGDRRLVPTPFPHAGYMARLWDQIHHLTTVIIGVMPWSVDSMLRQIVEERVTVIGAVPTQWEKLVQVPGIDELDLGSVRVGLSATAPARPELVERVKEVLGCPLVVRYAMTESPSIAGTRLEDPPEVQFRTVGRPQVGMEVSVLAGEGEVGMVRIRGACVMRGYWNDPARTAKAFDSEGWLLTGDLGYLDADGNLVLTGRSSDMYIRGGYNVYPAEVESLLVTHPKVANVSIVAAPAPTIGEIGVAFVVPAPGETVTLDELREFVRRNLADYKAPDVLHVIQELPANAMHKVNRSALREMAKASVTTETAPAPAAGVGR